jgi:hypothetical protein
MLELHKKEIAMIHKEIADKKVENRLEYLIQRKKELGIVVDDDSIVDMLDVHRETMAQMEGFPSVDSFEMPATSTPPTVQTMETSPSNDK